jgi:type 1 fimbria pilin
MRGKRWLVWTGCFLVAVLGTSAARAGGGGTVDSGTIRFAGAVVEPTCSIEGMQSVVSSAVSGAQTHQSLQQNCSDPTSAGGATASSSRPYTVDVVSLSGSEPDQVLRYFAGYVRAAQAAADPKLVTQTYQ